MVNGARLAFALLLYSVVFAITSAARSAQAPAKSIQDEVAQVFRAGQADMESAQWAEAVKEFKKVLQLEPSLVEARVNLGLAYHALGDYDLAVSELSRVARLKPNLLPANLFLGISFLKLGSPEKAIVPLDRALQTDPSNREGRQALAMAELSLGHYGKAAHQFQRLAVTNPDNADRWFTLGQDYLRLSKRLTADLSSKFGHTVWSFRLAGDILGERLLWNDAASAYGRALDQGPGPEGLHASLGMALLGARKTEDAASQFRAELAPNPFDPTAQLGMADVDLLKGNVSAAVERIEVIWKSAPFVLVHSAGDFPMVDVSEVMARQVLARLDGIQPQPPREFLRAAMFRILGDTERARQEVENLKNSAKAEIASMSKQTPPSRSDCERHHARLCAEYLDSQKNPQVGELLRLGRDLLALGRTEEASRAFAAAMERNSKNPEALYWLNRSYLLLSEECFNHLMVSYPHSWRTHELKAESLHLRQADHEAVEEYRIAQRLNPGNHGIHQALGEILLGQGKVEEAKSELGAALRLDPASARSLYLMGRLYVGQRESAKAIPYLVSALKRDPSLLEARPVLGKAYLRTGQPELAIPQLERSAAIDRYGDLHYQLYEAYRQAGKTKLAAQALARSQELRRRSVAEDQAKIRNVEQ